MSTVDVFKILSVQKVITDNDAQMILSAPSEHLKSHSLLETFQKLKLSVWIKMCELLNTKSWKHVSSQLIEGTCICKSL